MIKFIDNTIQIEDVIFEVDDESLKNFVEHLILQANFIGKYKVHHEYFPLPKNHFARFYAQIVFTHVDSKAGYFDYKNFGIELYYNAWKDKKRKNHLVKIGVAKDMHRSYMWSEDLQEIVDYLRKSNFINEHNNLVFS